MAATKGLDRIVMVQVPSPRRSLPFHCEAIYLLNCLGYYRYLLLILLELPVPDVTLYWIHFDMTNLIRGLLKSECYLQLTCKAPASNRFEALSM